MQRRAAAREYLVVAHEHFLLPELSSCRKAQPCDGTASHDRSCSNIGRTRRSRAPDAARRRLTSPVRRLQVAVVEATRATPVFPATLRPEHVSTSKMRPAPRVEVGDEAPPASARRTLSAGSSVATKRRRAGYGSLDVRRAGYRASVEASERTGVEVTRPRRHHVRESDVYSPGHSRCRPRH